MDPSWPWPWLPVVGMDGEGPLPPHPPAVLADLAGLFPTVTAQAERNEE